MSEDRITWTNESRRLGDLIAWPRNPRQIKTDQAKRLVESFDQFGQVETIAIGPGNEVYNGHQRLNVLAQKYGKDYEVEVRVSSRALTEKEREKLTVYLHKGAAGEWDWDTLANEFEFDELIEWGFSEKELVGLDFGEEKPEEESQDENPVFMPPPDAIFPSDNQWGIPLLDLSMQADMLIAPFSAWGTVPRTNRMSGTWHYYVEDYRFEQVWKTPEQVINTQCVACVEPNFSVYADMPAAVALWMIYRKRWIARWWQSQGIKVIVDLNVSHKHFELNWLGVPRGWKSYSTRAYQDRLNETEAEYRAALEYSGSNQILFIVYGGGKKARELSERNAWIWYQDQETAKGENRDG